MFHIADWYNNYQTPSVLMIDDLSDAYIDVYDESYKNDWGYLCQEKEGIYHFLKNGLLAEFPEIKITFFVPYERHNVINPNSEYKYYKFAVGERKEFNSFLSMLEEQGHEIAHHGSNHGKYIDINKVSTVKNFKHEWELFDNIKEGVEITMKGIETFKSNVNIDIVGGKFCGYMQKENSLEIIDRCKFLYWCVGINYINKDYAFKFFGKQDIISFPTNFAGNEFVRLIYKTGVPKRDRKKIFLQFLQPLYNFFQYKKLKKLYHNKEIISIQEHISPSTAAGTVQSANIVSDQVSLRKIYHFLQKRSIWYATSKDIAKYFYVKENTKLYRKKTQLIIDFKNIKNIKNTKISIISDQSFTLKNKTGVYPSFWNNQSNVATVDILNEENTFEIILKGNQ